GTTSADDQRPEVRRPPEPDEVPRVDVTRWPPRWIVDDDRVLGSTDHDDVMEASAAVCEQHDDRFARCEMPIELVERSGERLDRPSAPRNLGDQRGGCD